MGSTVFGLCFRGLRFQYGLCSFAFRCFRMISASFLFALHSKQYMKSMCVKLTKGEVPERLVEHTCRTAAKSNA